METNKEIRDAAKKNGIKLWKIADRIGIRDNEFSRKLRYELSNPEKEKIIRIIDELAEEEKENAGRSIDSHADGSEV